MLKLRLLTLSTITVTCGSEINFFIDSAIKSCSCTGVYPTALISPTSGREIMPSGRTCIVFDISGSFQTKIDSSSSAPITYESGRIPVGGLGGLSGAADWVGFAALAGAELPASCATAKLVKTPSRSTHFSNRMARISTLLPYKSIQVTFHL